MDSINLNKENGLKLWANDWNKLVSTMNLIIDRVNDLSENPTITKVSQLTNDAGFVTLNDISGKVNSSDLSTVATSGDYNDLLNKPESLQGIQGDSAYQVAVNNGFVGTEQLWLASLKGDPGLDGVAGLNGSNGQDGAPGLDGNDGLSAYQLAVLEGYDGTLQQWLDSLHGLNGSNGSNGQDGHSPVVTASKNNGVTTISIDGTAVATINDGLNGQNGNNGSDGVTPHIDQTTGNWFIGTTNTGVLALGPAGQNGSDGTNGTNGSNGTDGITPTVTVTSIFNGHNVSFSYGTGDSRNVDFDVMDGDVANQLQADWNQTNSSYADYIKNKPTLFSGSYNDLTDKPTIPSAPDLTNYVQKSSTSGLLKNDGTVDTNTYLTSHQDISGKANSADLATVATSGSYNDLTDKPTISTAPSSGYNQKSIPTAPSISNGREYVDLGLPSGTLWEKYNYGASSSPESGISSTDISGNIAYSLADNTQYRFKNNDIVNLGLGGSWHMPTKELYLELIDGCTASIIQTNNSDIRHVRFTSTADNTKYVDFRYYYFTSNHTKSHKFVSCTPSSTTPGYYHCLEFVYSNNDTEVTPILSTVYITYNSSFNTHNVEVCTRGVLDSAPNITLPTVPSNETATSGGTTLSVVTTGEKYTWNNKANIWRGTQAQYDLLTPDDNTIYIITSAS